MNLNQIREEIERTKLILNMDLTTVDFRNRPGWEGRQRQAKDTLESLETQLSEVLVANSVGILSDLNLKSFVDLASTQDETVVGIDANGLAVHITDTLFSEESTTYSFNNEFNSRVNNYLYSVMGDMGIRSMPLIRLEGSDYVVLHDRASAVMKTRDILDKTYGNMFIDVYVRRQIIKMANINMNKNKVGFIIYNLPGDVLKGLGSIFKTTKIMSVTPELNPNIRITGGETDEQLLELLTVKKDAKTTKPTKKTQTNGQSAEGETDV